MPDEATIDDVPEAADVLFGVPLGEFTERRNALARELEAAGRPSEARAVKALRKPRAPAWAVNQLARERSDWVAELVEITQRMTSVTAGEDLRAGRARRHELVAALTDAAAALMEEAGVKPTPSALRDVAQTLQAATTPERLARLRRGTLTEPLQAAGFGTLAPESLAAGDGSQGTGTTDTADKELEELKERLAEALAEVEAKSKSADRARKQAQAAERELEIAERAAQRLRDRIDKKKPP